MKPSPSTSAAEKWFSETRFNIEEARPRTGNSFADAAIQALDAAEIKLESIIKAEYAGVVDCLKRACRIHTAWMIGRYLMSNAEGRADGAEKAERHRDLVLFYVALFRGGDPDHAGRDYPEDYERLHEETQELTGSMDEVIGFPIHGMPDYADLEPKFFEKFHEIATRVLG